MATVLASAAPSRAGFLPGDVLLNNFSGHNIEQIRASGILEQTFTGTGQYWVGAALTPDGKLVTVYRNIGTTTVDVFVP
ncbi:MAG: hypothetical protein AB7U73_24015 [Pirellulales bacterium]